MSDLVVIARYSFPHEANLAKMNLEASGIQAFVADEHTINMQWLYSNAMGGVRLFVNKSDVENALQVLNNDMPVEYDDPFAEEPEEDGTSEVKQEVNPLKTSVNPVIKIGYVIVKFFCWLFFFRAIYFSIYVFSSGGLLNSLLSLLYFGWIPAGLLYIFHKYYEDGAGYFSQPVVKAFVSFIGKSFLVVGGLAFVVWFIKALTN